MKNLVSLFALIIAFSLLASCKAYRNPNNLNPKYPIKSPELADKIPGLQNLLVGDQLKITGIDKSVKFLVYSGMEQGHLSGDLRKDQGRKLGEPEHILIPLDQIDFIKVKRKSVGATLAWTLGLGVAATVGIIIILVDVYSELGPDNL